jgi:DNA-binding XRE family transcriptional regulator
MKCLKLLLFRKEHELKQYEMADKLGITRQHYNRLENGKSNPSEKLYQKIEKEFEDVKNARDLFNRS